MTTFLTMHLDLKSGQNPSLVITADPDTAAKIEQTLQKDNMDFTFIPNREWKQIGKTDKARQMTTSYTISPRTWNHLEVIWLVRTVLETLFGK